MTNRKTPAMPTGTGVHVHGPVVTPVESEHRPPPASRLPSWVIEDRPATAPKHDLNGFCWCQPLVETDPVTGDHLFIHRRSLDSPHIEV